MAGPSRACLRGANAFVAGLAGHLADDLAPTRVGVAWRPGGRAVSPGCPRRAGTPSYFRRPGLTPPPAGGVITLACGGTERPALAGRLAQGP
jgi:hypothetical protein